MDSYRSIFHIIFAFQSNFSRVQWEPAPGLSAVKVLITSRENESPVTKALSPITDVFPLLTFAEIKEKL